eukprot:7377025-Prymnesium_polylepis.1
MEPVRTWRQRSWTGTVETVIVGSRGRTLTIRAGAASSTRSCRTSSSRGAGSCMPEPIRRSMAVRSDAHHRTPVRPPAQQQPTTRASMQPLLVPPPPTTCTYLRVCVSARICAYLLDSYHLHNSAPLLARAHAAARPDRYVQVIQTEGDDPHGPFGNFQLITIVGYERRWAGQANLVTAGRSSLSTARNAEASRFDLLLAVHVQRQHQPSRSRDAPRPLSGQSGRGRRRQWRRRELHRPLPL